MLATLKTMIRDDEGATMVEYGLLVALIALVALGAVTTLGKNLSGLFSSVAGTL
ncbi:MAG: Flp family type IVb pilin [Candidatus Eremiobacteraeota bacterium]|jgi:pilus assembly protein Flp/PilA|nr:Flp family type IVb pilin [Candidatus Eremiobacteraeota bacterium]MBV8499286.1 Flp family type IVb pilin [Candidatus Eremiobacteraeota bacterium]